MLGYVTAEKSELKMREYEIYGGYYCGVCKSIGRRYGQLPRMVLSYDAAFLALLLASVNPDKDEPYREHCIIHHIKKKVIVDNDAVDYAADVMLILAWHKVLDDAKDEGKLYAKTTLVVMKKLYARLQQQRPSLCRKVEENLEELSILEHEQCANLDKAAETFAQIMEAILEEGPTPEGFREQKVLGRIGYHLGKWIYLMDAIDDIEENIESGVYNPLLYRFQYEKGETDFRGRITDSCKFNLFHYLGEISKATDLLAIKKNRGIIENIVYMGLLRRTEQIFQKEEK